MFKYKNTQLISGEIRPVHKFFKLYAKLVWIISVPMALSGWNIFVMKDTFLFLAIDLPLLFFGLIMIDKGIPSD
jgi:hypothetical protein